MSRVADALRRRGREAPLDAIDPADHPWSSPTDSGDRSPHGGPGVLPRHDGAAGDSPFNRTSRAWTDAAPAREARPQAAPADSADEEMRGRLAVLVQQVFLGPTPPACTGFLPVGACSAAAALTATVCRVIAEQSDRTVCAIDLDTTAPRLHRSFDIPCSPGVLDRHVGGGCLIRSAREVQPQLWVIPGGRVPPGQAAVPRVSAKELEALRDTFDILVMTLEPHTGATAPPSLAAASAVILVIDADTTRRDTARSVTDMLRRSGTGVLGAVLVNRRYPIPGAVYGRL